MPLCCAHASPPLPIRARSHSLPDCPRLPPQALQQLEGQAPLPHLFMRTVIVALQTHPKLMGAILVILTNMINKEVGPRFPFSPLGAGDVIQRAGCGRRRMDPVFQGCCWATETPHWRGLIHVALKAAAPATR
jgi:hypothetical protein